MRHWEYNFWLWYSVFLEYFIDCLTKGLTVFDSAFLTLSIISCFASILSFFMANGSLGARVGRAFYVLFVAIVIAFFSYDQFESKEKNQKLQAQLDLITTIEYRAAQVLKNTPRFSDGEKRGFIFTSLIFLERNKDTVPDAYSLAREYAVASGVLTNEQEDGMKRLHQSWRLADASDAMESLLNGLSAGRAYDQ